MMMLCITLRLKVWVPEGSNLIGCWAMTKTITFTWRVDFIMS